MATLNSVPMGTSYRPAIENEVKLDVQTALVHIDKRIVQLHEQCERLEQRLQVVLVPQHPSTTNQMVDVDDKDHSQVVNALVGIDSALLNMLNRLEALHWRIEL